MSAREQVAKAIFEATYPGWRWEQLESVHLEEWGRVADIAIAAYERTRVDEIAEAVEKRLRQRDRERGIVR